jgi:hypothetical protein
MRKSELDFEAEQEGKINNLQTGWLYRNAPPPRETADMTGHVPTIAPAPNIPTVTHKKEASFESVSRNSPLGPR